MPVPTMSIPSGNGRQCPSLQGRSHPETVGTTIGRPPFLRIAQTLAKRFKSKARIVGHEGKLLNVALVAGPVGTTIGRPPFLRIAEALAKRFKSKARLGRAMPVPTMSIPSGNGRQCPSLQGRSHPETVGTTIGRPLFLRIAEALAKLFGRAMPVPTDKQKSHEMLFDPQAFTAGGWYPFRFASLHR